MSAVSRGLRDAVVRRAGNRCEYCHLPQGTQVATFPVDHIAPKALGGETLLDNLALACPRCNTLKWTHVEATDPASGEAVSIFHPQKQVWAEHFRWSDEDSTIIEPLTPSGRATAELLDLNSEARRNIRRWLIEVGMHP